MRVDLNIIRGSTETITGVARKRDGTVIDLTGATITWRIGPTSRGQSDLSITGTVVTAATGDYTVTLSAANSATLNADTRYRHEAEVVESGGDVTTILTGYIYLAKDMP